ncbi:MAG: hypothetical protein H5U30_03695, partial [Marinobacter sp.]|nr:hypothetical protein [Marinobacter sp.]
MVLRTLFITLSILVGSQPVALASSASPAEISAGLESFRRAGQGGIDLGDERQRALYLKAEAARLGGKTDAAGRVLAGMKEGYWAAVGYLNLSTDYAREDLNPARALVALRVALAMLEGDSDSGRRDALRNRLLVRADYLAFQHGEHEKAISF